MVTYTIKRLIPGEEIQPELSGRVFVAVANRQMEKAHEEDQLLQIKFGEESMVVSTLSHWDFERSFPDKWGRKDVWGNDYNYFLLYYEWQKEYAANACMSENCGKCGTTWKNGINSAVRSTQKYKDWREAVRIRDNYTCVQCGKKRGKVILDVDHYPLSFAQLLKQYNISTVQQALDTPELWRLENGRCLCRPCHTLTPTYSVRLAQQPMQAFA